jgi:hypothetical protein
MKNRLSYGYFHSQEDAEVYLDKMKKVDELTKKSFVYRCEKRDRFKEGRKRWIAYRLKR